MEGGRWGCVFAVDSIDLMCCICPISFLLKMKIKIERVANFVIPKIQKFKNLQQENQNSIPHLQQCNCAFGWHLCVPIFKKI